MECFATACRGEFRHIALYGIRITKTVDHDIGTLGSHGSYIESIDTIVTHVTADARPGDVVAVLSNGGFGGIHGKLLTALEAKG